MSAISVVTTTFNRPDYLKEAIRSALLQTFEDFELLVCDDGGQEETKRICEGFRDTRIRHIVNDSPLGIALNTYSGVKQASSDLITFLNDDDRWTPEFLAKCVPPLLTDANVILCFCDHWLIDAEGKPLLQETENNSIQFGRSSLAGGPVAEPLKLIVRNSIPLAMGSVFRKSAVDWSRYSKKVEGAYDFFLSYCLLRSGGKVVFVPERLTEYRLHSRSAGAELHLTNTSGAAYVHSLILNDPLFHFVARDIRIQAIGFEDHLAKLYLRRCDLVSTAFHARRSLGYRFSRVWRHGDV
jgi:glycosyltransferase involved in cell wall biosynthesis